MGTSKIDFTSVTAAIPEAVQNMSDLIKLAAFDYGNFADFITIEDNVDYDKKVGYLGKMTDFGKKALAGQKCKLNEVAVSIPASEKTWTPRPWDSRLFFCQDDLNNTIAMKLLNKGIRKYDMLGTEYMNTVEEYFAEAFGEFNWRIAWFADENAANVSDSPGGNISDTVDVSLVNMSNGLFKRLEQLIASRPNQRIEIEDNAKETTAEQYDETTGFTPTKAYSVAKDLFYKAPRALRQVMKNAGVRALCTQAYHDKLKQYFQGKDLETILSYTENGIETIKVNGVDFIAVPEWDEMIEKYQNLGEKFHNPFRVVLTSRDNLRFGVPSVSDWSDFEMWYEKKDKGVYLDVADKFDTQIAQDELVMYAV